MPYFLPISRVPYAPYLHIRCTLTSLPNPPTLPYSCPQEPEAECRHAHWGFNCLPPIRSRETQPAEFTANWPPGIGAWKLVRGCKQNHMGGGGGCPQCRMSILRNGNAPCHYLSKWHVNKKNIKIMYDSNIVSDVDNLHAACWF